MKARYVLFLIALIPFQGAFGAEKNQLEKPASPAIHISVDTYQEDVPIETYSQWKIEKSEMSIDETRASEIENIEICPFGKKVACEIGMPYSSRFNYSLQTKSKIDEPAIKAYIEDLAKKANHDPVEAKFEIADGRVTNFIEDKPGITLDIDKSLQEIKNAILTQQPESKISIKLPYIKKNASVTAAEINNLGVATLIGEGKSNFKGSPSNRIRNIKVATERFKGVLIKPEEEFSFVKILGEVDGEHGYLPELVIKKNKTEPEFGGGICQVSTTIFRAAIYSGLKITMRSNHAYPISYYNPPGMDATIYIPRPDLRFKNNTPGYILIQPKFNGTELVMEFYGTNDGRRIEVDGPKIIESNPDKSMKTTFTQKVFNKDGNILIDDVFNSNYQSPYKYPHPGDAMLAAKPSNWSDTEWESYKDAYRAVNPPVKKKK